MTTLEPKVAHVRLLDLRPCPENDAVYGKQSLDDPDIVELVKSIRAKGVMEPIQISADNVIISGHRRRFCALEAGLLTVPVIRNNISYEHDREEFLKLLVEANTQRKKTGAMLLREEAMKVDPEQAYEELKRERQEKENERRFWSDVSDQEVEAKNVKGRKKISPASMPFLEAALEVINAHREFWPLSVRQIHYRLLGPDAPLKHASKPDSRYENDKDSYKTLTDLLARGRVEGRVPWDAIDDETRPEMLNNDFWNTGEFFKGHIDYFLTGYRRHRQQSQEDHIEIIAEKLTVKTILESVAAKYSIPLTINRGMSGPTVKRKIVQRYLRSKKRNLILLVVSDLDPAGMTIAQDIRDAFERDFGIHESRIQVYKAALTIDQVNEMELEPSMAAKESSPTYAAFVEKYGTTNAYELEALEPVDLQQVLVDAIEEVMDMDAYQAEVDAEKGEAVDIFAAKQLVVGFMKTINIGG
jgi:ParB-like nuclease domain